MDRKLSLSDNVWLSVDQLKEVIEIIESQNTIYANDTGDYRLIGKFADYDYFIDSDSDVQVYDIIEK